MNLNWLAIIVLCIGLVIWLVILTKDAALAAKQDDNIGLLIECLAKSFLILFMTLWLMSYVDVLCYKIS